MIHANQIGITPRDIPVTQKQFNDLAAIVATKTKLEFVDSLPETGDPTIIYCVMSTSAETGNLYDEYIWKDNSWEQISSEVRQIDLEDYYKKVETDALLAVKQDKLTGQNAGYGINIYDYNPDAIDTTDYHRMNNSYQLVDYEISDSSAWYTERTAEIRGISCTDTLSNLSSRVFEYKALVPYSPGAGIGLKLAWDYDSSIVAPTDGIAFSGNGGEEPSSSGFIISGAYYKKTNTISISADEYIQIQNQGGMWFKITHDDSNTYHAYYSINGNSWTEVIFSDDTSFYPEHANSITSPCIGCVYTYNASATFNLNNVSFQYGSGGTVYTKIDLNETVIDEKLSSYVKATITTQAAYKNITPVTDTMYCITDD